MRLWPRAELMPLTVPRLALVIDVSGSEDSITIQDWYANSAQQLDVFQAGGSSLYANQVDSLVNAMAAGTESAQG